jgi:hypothetical protein
MRWALVHVVGLYTGGLYSGGGLIVGGLRYVNKLQHCFHCAFIRIEIQRRRTCQLIKVRNNAKCLTRRDLSRWLNYDLYKSPRSLSTSILQWYYPKNLFVVNYFSLSAYHFQCKRISHIRDCWAEEKDDRSWERYREAGGGEGKLYLSIVYTVTLDWLNSVLMIAFIFLLWFQTLRKSKDEEIRKFLPFQTA